MYHEDWYVGVASPQLLHNNLKFKSLGLSTDSYLEDHIYINAGYIFKIGSDIELEPTALLKFGFPAPLKLDIGLKAMYKNAVWLGIGYRTQDALTTMIGYNHKNNLSFGYAYDFTTTLLKGYNSGSHALFFAIKFGSTKGNSSTDLE